MGRRKLESGSRAGSLTTARLGLTFRWRRRSCRRAPGSSRPRVGSREPLRRPARFRNSTRVFPSLHGAKLAAKSSLSMLGWALTFLTFALAAGYLGFFELAGLGANIARILLLLFVILMVVSAFTGTVRGASANVRRRD